MQRPLVDYLIKSCMFGTYIKILKIIIYEEYHVEDLIT